MKYCIYYSFVDSLYFGLLDVIQHTTISTDYKINLTYRGRK